MIYEDLAWIFLEWRRYQQRRLKPFHITIQQFALMRAIAREGSMCANEAAQFLHCDSPTLSVIIANLQKKGFLDRIPDENDKRRCRLVITEKGVSEIARIKSGMPPLGKKPFDCLTAQQRRQLAALLSAGRKNLESIMEEEPI